MANEIRRFFDEHGYYLARGVFDPATVAELERDFDSIVRQISGAAESIDARWSGPEVERLGAMNTTVLHTHNVQQYSACWLKAFLDDELLDVVEDIIGPDIVLHHSKLFQKPPENGAPFPMHQDWPYFPSVRDSLIAGVIHVSEATDEMGCVRVYPGTHKLGRLKDATGQTESDALAGFPIEGALPLEAQPGDVAFFHYFTIHGSLPNRSQKTRKTVLMQVYSGEDQIEDGNTHPNERLVLRGWNHRITRTVAGATK